MKNDSDLVLRVYNAKTDSESADDLIERYLPFIRAEASRVCGRFCTDQDDEVSIAMMAFYEAVQKYDETRGNFLSFASILIRSRLVDEMRKDARRTAPDSFSLDESLHEAALVADQRDEAEVFLQQEAAEREIQEFSRQLSDFDLTLFDVAAQCPKQERVREVCRQALFYAKRNVGLIQKLVETKKLPLKELSKGAGVSRKTLERHRNYVLALMLIYSNGYELIRMHLDGMSRSGEGGLQ